MTEPDPSRRFAAPSDVIAFIDKWKGWERMRLRAWLVGSLSVGAFLVLATLGVGIWYVTTLKPSRQPLGLDVKIKSATPPSISELAARAERPKEDAASAVSTNKENSKPSPTPQFAAPQPVPAPQSTQTLQGTVSQPVPASQSTQAPQGVVPQPTAPQPTEHVIESPRVVSESPATSSSVDENSLEALMAKYLELADDASGGGRRQIAAAVNDARRFDPDFTAYSAEGRSLRGQRDLSAEDALVYRRGMVFLKIEIYRRKNGKMPSLDEVRELLRRD